jgi:hypothetical protein
MSDETPTTPLPDETPPKADEQAKTPADELREKERQEREARMRARGNPNVPDREDPTTADAGETSNE